MTKNTAKSATLKSLLDEFIVSKEIKEILGHYDFGSVVEYTKQYLPEMWTKEFEDSSELLSRRDELSKSITKISEDAEKAANEARAKYLEDNDYSGLDAELAKTLKAIAKVESEMKASVTPIAEVTKEFVRPWLEETVRVGRIRTNEFLEARRDAHALSRMFVEDIVAGWRLQPSFTPAKK